MDLCTDNNYACLDGDKACLMTWTSGGAGEDKVISQVAFKEQGDEFSSEAAGCSMAL